MSSSPEVIKNEYHVASFVIHAIKGKQDRVTEDILQLDGTEIHAISEEGKIVFTVEADSQFAIGKIIDTLKLHTGIYNLSPVYHQFLPQG